MIRYFSNSVSAKHSLAGSDFPYTLELLIEVFIGQKRAAFEPLIVHDPTFDRVLPGDLVDPLAKLDRPFGIDLETNCYDHLEIVVCNVPRNLASPFFLNY